MRSRICLRGVLTAAVFVLVGTRAFADSGWSWQNPLPQGNHLQATAAVGPASLITVGWVGTILRTDDGGATWVTQASGTTENLWGVSFTDANTGTAVGGDGTILRTTTGGDPAARAKS